MSKRGERLYRGHRGKAPVEVKHERSGKIADLRGKYADIGPFLDDFQEGKLVALREVREMLVAENNIPLDPHVSVARCLLKVNALIAKEEQRK